MVVFVHGGCIRVRVIEFGQNLLYSGKVILLEQR